MYLAMCALIPLLAGVCMPFIKFPNRRLSVNYALAATVLTSACVFWALAQNDTGAFVCFRLSDAFVCAFKTDGAGKVFIALSALLWPLAMLYADEYMLHEAREGQFFAFYTLAYGVTILLCASANLFTMYLFYECLTLVTLPLVEHEQDKQSFRAARAYMVYLIGGAALGFVCLALVNYASPGDFALGGIRGLAGGSALEWAFMCAFFGFGAKAAVFPLCFWLPKASVAPTPVTALLHAVAVVNAGVFAVMRCVYYVFGAEILYGSFAQTLALCVSGLTVLYGAVRAAREGHLKRRLAWSTVSNLGYMLFGLSLMTKGGMAAALMHMAFHGLMKITLFFAAGAILIYSGGEYVRETRGLARRMPVTFFAFLFSGMALCGVPPLCGFLSKYALISAAVEAGGWAQLFGCACLIASSVLTAVYIFSAAIPAYYAPGNALSGARDPGWKIKTALLSTCACVLAASLMSGRIIDAIRLVAGS